MKNSATILGVVLLASAMAADSATTDGIAVAGRVLVPGGAPLPEAEVRLLPLSDPLVEARDVLEGRTPEATVRALTGPGGRFELRAPRAGLWRVRVEAPGFAPLETDLEPLIEPIELPDAELAPDSKISVRVRDAAGKAVGGAGVLLYTDRSGTPFRRSTWQVPLRGGTTDEHGLVRLARAEGERTSLSVSAPRLAGREIRGLHGTAANVELASGAPVTLEVRGSDDRPVPEALIAVGDELPHPLGTTDDRGRISIRPGDGKISILAGDGRRLETRLPAAPPDPAKPRRLVLPDRVALPGRLIDAESRKPIPGGVVWDRENPGEAVLSDRAGGFVLQGPPGRRLWVTAGAPGYLPASPFEVQLVADGRPGPTLALRPAAAIEGVVRDADGKPVAGAAIEAAVKSIPGSVRIEIGPPVAMPRNLSGSRGQFRLSPLDPDKSFIVKADAEGFAPAQVPVVGLEPYRTRTGVVVTLSPGGSVTGTVVDGAGSPLRDAAVRLQPAATRHGMIRVMGADQAAVSFEGSTGDDGRFRVAGLPEGKFDLRIQRRGFATKEVPAVEIASGNVDVGEISLRAGERVQGHVLDRDGVPVEGAEVFVAPAGGMMMMLTGQGPGTEEPRPDAVTDSAGWFAIDDLEPGKSYMLRFRRTGFVEGGVGPFEVPRIEPLEAVLDPASVVAGRVVNSGGEPVGGAQVRMQRSRTIEMGGNVMRTIMMSSDSADDQGRFRFEDQEPGPLSLSALASGYQEAKLDGLEVPKGKDLTGIEITLPEGAVVVGRVLTPDGRPAIGASVRPTGEGEEFERALEGVVADGDGRYRLEGLPPGHVSVEAVHPDYPRAVKDLEAREGINSLDLQFEGGFEVAGRVLDTAGNAVAGAAVRLVPEGRMWGGPEGESGPDGNFTLPGVQDGTYQLRAEAEGYAPSPGTQRLTVAGEPVAGLEIRLDAGGAVYGRVTGLEAERFGDVTVRAEGASPTGFEAGSLDYEGNYRIPNLLPGSYRIVATLARSGRQARGEVDLEAGVPEVRLDLQFGAGVTLSGRATQGDRAVVGATVFAEGIDVDHTGWNETDQDGAFSIDGLEPGRYRIHLRNWRTGLAYSENVELATSRDIMLDVPTATVAGRVRDAADRQPLEGVSLVLTAEDAPGGRLPLHSATTDLEGKFEFANVADGSWKLNATKKGYAAVSRSVTVQSGKVAGDPGFAMEPTEGLTLETHLPSGAAPNDVRVAVLDPAGGALVSGTYATGESGRVRLSSVPPGTWTLVISAAGSATSVLEAHAPGATVAVMLQPPCGLRVTVPELQDAGVPATMRLRDGAGRPFYGLDWDSRPHDEWRLSGGSAEIGSLPPGSWTVSVSTSDGRSWQATAATSPGATAAISLP